MLPGCSVSELLRKKERGGARPEPSQKHEATKNFLRERGKHLPEQAHLAFHLGAFACLCRNSLPVSY